MVFVPKFKDEDKCKNCGKPESKHYALFDLDEDNQDRLKPITVTNSNYFCKKDGVAPFFVPVRVLELEGLVVELQQIAEVIEKTYTTSYWDYRLRKSKSKGCGLKTNGLVHDSKQTKRKDLEESTKRLRVLAEQIKKGEKE